MAAKRSSVVRAREGVGVTMFLSEAPLADRTGDDSAVLESNTSPERETHKLHTHSYRRVNTYFRFTHTHESTIPSH